MAEEKSTAISPLKQFNLVLHNEKTKKYLTDVLGKKAQSYVNNIVALVSNDAKLQVCEPMTLIMAGIKATALDLPLDNNLGFAYVIPYKNKKEGITVAQFQIGYKGFMQLALRTGLFKHINVTDVKEGEIVSEDFLSGENVYKRLPATEREKAKIIGYVAYIELHTGFKKSKYMTVEEVKAHAQKYSQTFKQGYGIWIDNEESMALKTPLKLLLSKYAPMSIEIQNAIKYDQSVIKDENDNLEYPDNLPEPTENAQKFSDDMKAKFGAGTQTEIPATEYEEIKKD